MVPLMMKAHLCLKMSNRSWFCVLLLNGRQYGPRNFRKQYPECCACITAFVLSGAHITLQRMQFYQRILDIFLYNVFGSIA